MAQFFRIKADRATNGGPNHSGPIGLSAKTGVLATTAAALGSCTVIPAGKIKVANTSSEHECGKVADPKIPISEFVIQCFQMQAPVSRIVDFIDYDSHITREERINRIKKGFLCPCRVIT